MKGNYKELQDGDQVNAGDIIVAEHLGGQRSRYVVTRVTPKFAFVRHSDVYEAKYQRTVTGLGLREVPRPTWGTTSYTVYRSVKPEGK